MTSNFSDTEAKYSTLFERLLDRREQILQFKSFLEKERSWLKAPASARFHLNVAHGLLIHSLGVTYNAQKIKDIVASAISDESILVAAQFRDIRKIGQPGKSYYLPNDNKW
jgi:hypothetical protein